MTDMTDQLMSILKDKKSLISFLINIAAEAQKEQDGLMRLSDSLTREEPNLKPENMAKCVAAVMKVTAKQAHTIQRLSLIALIQAQSSSFDSDLAQMLNKMGKGQEALRAMMEAKLKGR